MINSWLNSTAYLVIPSIVNMLIRWNQMQEGISCATSCKSTINIHQLFHSGKFSFDRQSLGDQSLSINCSVTDQSQISESDIFGSPTTLESVTKWSLSGLWPVTNQFLTSCRAIPNQSLITHWTKKSPTNCIWCIKLGGNIGRRLRILLIWW